MIYLRNSLFARSAYLQLLVAVVVMHLCVFALLFLGLAVTVAVDAQTYGRWKSKLYPSSACDMTFSKSEKKKKKYTKLAAPINFRSRYFHQGIS